MPRSYTQLSERRDLLLQRGVYRMDTARPEYLMLLLVTSAGEMYVYGVRVRDDLTARDLHRELRHHLDAIDPQPQLHQSHRELPSVPASVLAMLLSTGQIDPSTVLTTVTPLAADVPRAVRELELVAQTPRAPRLPRRA